MSTLKVEEIYKHVNCRDMAIRVLRVKEHLDFLSLFVQYLNVSSENLYCMAVEEIKIKKSELSNWKPFKAKERV